MTLVEMIVPMLLSVFCFISLSFVFYYIETRNVDSCVFPMLFIVFFVFAGAFTIYSFEEFCIARDLLYAQRSENDDYFILRTAEVFSGSAMMITAFLMIYKLHSKYGFFKN